MKSQTPNERENTAQEVNSRAATAPLAGAVQAPGVKAVAEKASKENSENGETPQNPQQTSFNAVLNSADPADFSSRGQTATPESHSVAAQTVIQKVAEAAEQMRSDGRSNVELRVRLSDGQEISVRLQVTRGGEMHAILKTSSEPLREALQQRWTEFSTQAGEKSLRVVTPVFEAPGSPGGGVNDFDQQQQQQRRDPESWRQDSSRDEFLQNHPRFSALRAATRAGAGISQTPNQTQTREQSEAGLALYA